MPTYDIERYLNVRRAYGASFGPAGERLSFLMDTTGTPQVWSVEGPGVWPEQHTFSEERVTFAEWSPERPELAFGMDEGGNERAQLYRLDPGSGEVTNLTRRPGAKHRWGGWAPDGERFAFTSNRRDEAVFDVYLQGRDAVGDGAELVHEGSGWLSVAGWSPDGDRLAVVEAYSNYDQDVYVLDVATGEFRQVTPHEATARHRSVEWGPDGEGLYLVTDRDADTLRLCRLDLGDLTVETVVDGGEWNVGGVAVDAGTGRLAYSRNVEGYTDLTVGELVEPARVEPFSAPDLPEGVFGGVDFSPDGDRLALSGSTGTDNTNVHVLDVETGEAERYTRAASAGIPRETFVDSELVRYGSFDGLEVPAFWSTPSDSAGEEGGDGPERDVEGDGLPVVVSIHGGPESQRRPSFSGVKQYFLNHGYAYFEPNVRGSSGYGNEYAHLDDVEKRLDSVRDVRAGVEWLREQPRVDPDRIVAMGGSYGGFMVLASLTEYPDLWAAGVDIVGIANFVTFLENTGEWRRELREAEYGSLEEDRELLEEISPIHRAEDIACPLFVLHGANDPRVPVDEAEQVVEAVREEGVPVRKRIFEDEGHGFSKLENRIEAYSAVVEFLDEHV